MDGHPAPELKRGDLSQAYQDIGDTALIVYVPGMDILLTRINLPGGRKTQLRNALPYALEDSLIDDVETLHCALGSRIDDSAYHAAVVADEAMQYWQTLLQEAGLYPKVMQPDTLLLPWRDGQWSLFCEGDIVRVRTGAAEGFICSTDSLSSFLKLTLDNSGQPRPDSLLLSHCNHGAVELSELPEEIEIIRDDKHSADTIDAYLLITENTEPAINLLQGPYAPDSRIHKQLQPWYATAALAVVLLLLGLGNNILEYQSLSRQSTQLQDQMMQVFQSVYPGARNVSNPYQRMQSELKKTQGAHEELLFREMLTQIAPVARSTRNIKIMNLRYHQGQIELLVELPDLESLEGFKQQLQKNTPWEVTLRSADASEDKVMGRLLISRPT
jgi:general secretion pathway protein L